MSSAGRPEESGIERREFLRVLAGAGLILGLGGLSLPNSTSAQEAGPKPLEQALERMKAKRLEGLVIVVPRGTQEQAALGKRLQALIPIVQAHRPVPLGGQLLLQVVWVCASAEEAQAKPGETVVLLDSSGKRQAGLKLDLSAKPAQTLAKLQKLIEGEGRLEKRAKRSRENPKIAAALDGLRDPKQAGSHYSTLHTHFAEAAPAIVAQIRAEQDQELLGNLKSILGQGYWRLLNSAKSFPYGVTWKLNVIEPEPCPPCGMAAPSLSGRTFLRFYTR
jgi:hypothetical protein